MQNIPSFYPADFSWSFSFCSEEKSTSLTKNSKLSKTIMCVITHFCFPAQTGDFAAVTVKVSPACGCQQDSGLYWVLMRDDQFVAWGQQPTPTDENGECVYRFG